MRVAGVALVVVLVGLFAWWMSGPAPRRVRTGTVSQQANPFEQAPKPVTGSGNFSGLGQKTSWRGSDTVSTFPVRAPEPEIYTALVGDGPVSESGPGSVTELYPASRVSYITTSYVASTGGGELPDLSPVARPREPEPEFRPLPRGEPLPTSSGTGSGRDRSLDQAIEGGLGTGGARRPDNVPGQIR